MDWLGILNTLIDLYFKYTLYFWYFALADLILFVITYILCSLILSNPAYLSKYVHVKGGADTEETFGGCMLCVFGSGLLGWLSYCCFMEDWQFAYLVLRIFSVLMLLGLLFFFIKYIKYIK